MPRITSKVVVTDFNEPEIKPETVEQPPEVIEEITEPIEEIPEPIEEIPEPVPIKAKPKTKAKAKAKPIEPIPEPIAIEPEPVKKEEVKKMVNCPKCDRLLTEKGLRYSHKCPADKTIKEQPQIIERIIEKEITKEPDYSKIPEDIIEKEISRRMKNVKEARMQKRDENIKKLAQNIA